MAPPDQQKVSDQLVRLVQVFFALVLGESLVVFKDVLLNPFAYALAAVAWGTVFYTIVASWIDWHVVMARRPYDTRQQVDRFRIYSDVAIAVLYAYLLFTIEPLIANPSVTLIYHLLGYPLVFVLYLASGLLRRWVHGKKASRPSLIVWALVAYSSLTIGYHLIRTHAIIDANIQNGLTLAVVLMLMFGYRRLRRHRIQREEQRERRLVIGIDVDGVLADQITGVLPRIAKRYGVVLTYDDITDWCLPIKDSDIKREILRAQEDRMYVIDMPVHEGARRLLKFIGELHRVVVITARKGNAAIPWTTEWLKKKRLGYDEVVATSEARKSTHRTDMLIDDFVGNIEDYLKSTKGVAVLIDQPWNRDRRTLEEAFASEERLFVVTDLLELRMSWPGIVSKAREMKATAEA